MTVEIRELVIHVEVTESSQSSPLVSPNSHKEWNEQYWIDKVIQEVLERLLERGNL